MMDGRASTITRPTMDQKLSWQLLWRQDSNPDREPLQISFYHLTPLTFSISPVSVTIVLTRLSDKKNLFNSGKPAQWASPGRARGRGQGGPSLGEESAPPFRHHALPPWLRLSCLCPRTPLLIKLLFCQHGGAHSDSRGFVRVMLWGVRQKGAAGQSL